MMTLAAAPVSLPRSDGLRCVQRLDRDKRFAQERSRHRVKIIVAAGDGGKLDGSASRYQGATGLADPIAERNGLFLP